MAVFFFLIYACAAVVNHYLIILFLIFEFNCVVNMISFSGFFDDFNKIHLTFCYHKTNRALFFVDNVGRDVKLSVKNKGYSPYYYFRLNFNFANFQFPLYYNKKFVFGVDNQVHIPHNFFKNYYKFTLNFDLVEQRLAGFNYSRQLELFYKISGSRKKKPFFKRKKIYRSIAYHCFGPSFKLRIRKRTAIVIPAVFFSNIVNYSKFFFAQKIKFVNSRLEPVLNLGVEFLVGFIARYKPIPTTYRRFLNLFKRFYRFIKRFYSIRWSLIDISKFFSYLKPVRVLFVLNYKLFAGLKYSRSVLDIYFRLFSKMRFVYLANVFSYLKNDKRVYSVFDYYYSSKLFFRANGFSFSLSRSSFNNRAIIFRNQLTQNFYVSTLFVPNVLGMCRFVV
jgi:hypothetical protein